MCDSVSPPQEFLLTSASPKSIETLGEAILNLSGQICLLPSRPVIICLELPCVSCKVQGPVSQNNLNA